MAKSFPISVTIGEFEGPFDLLLELVKQRKLDISSVSLCDITDEALHYIEQHNVHIDVQADFLHVASYLVALKSKQLLPVIHDEELEDEDTLAKHLQAYKPLRDIAEQITAKWNKGAIIHAKQLAEPTSINIVDMPTMPKAEYFRLAMQHVINQIPKPAHQVAKAHLVTRGKSLKQHISWWRESIESLKKSNKNIIFQEHIKQESSQEIATSFLALLELAKQNTVTLRQESLFADLEIHSL